MPGVAQKLNVQVCAADGGLALYFNQENQLTVTVTNNSAGPLTLKGGTPVSEGRSAPTGPTAFYVMFGGALSANEISKIETKKPGWNPGTFFDGSFPAIALVPASDLTLAANESVELVLTNIVVTGVAQGATLTVDYVNVPGAAPDSATFQIATQDPPAGGKALGLDASVVGEGIILTTQDPINPLSNGLTVRLMNYASAPIAIPPTAVFNIWFLYARGHGYNALATPDEAKQISLQAVRIGEQSRDNWAPRITDDNGGRRWTLASAAATTIEANSGLELTFDGIVTTLGGGPTALFIQHAGMGPIYNDGYDAIALEKIAPAPGVVYFRPVTPDVIQAGDAVTFSWQTVGVTSLLLSYKNELQYVTLTSEHGDIPLNAPAGKPFSLPTPPLVDTTYYLRAVQPSGTSGVPSVAISVITPPVSISKFSLSPPAVNFSAGPATLNVSWQVTPGNLVKQLLLEVNPTTTPVDVTGQTGYTINGCAAAGPVKLTAFGVGGDQASVVFDLQDLASYLVGKNFGVHNTFLHNKPGDAWWYSETTDALQFVGPAAAAYSISCTVWDDPPPHAINQLPKTFSCTAVPWSLDGTTVSVTTGTLAGVDNGVMQLQFTNDGTLKFLNLPNVPDLWVGYAARPNPEMSQV